MNWLGNLFNKQPNPDQFAQIASNYLANKGNGVKTRYNKKDFAIEVLDEKGEIKNVFYLGNCYRDYCQTETANKPQVLQIYLNPAQSLPETLEEARDQLLPRLQPRAFYEHTSLASQLNKHGGAATSFDYKTLGEHYGIALVFDGPTQITYINEEQLLKWGTTLDACLEIAKDNLRKLSTQPMQESKPGVYTCPYLDSHGASRIVLDEYIAQCAVKGRPIAFTPNRDTLYITGEDDHEGLQTALQLNSQAAQDPRAIPVFPMVYDDEKWQQWIPDADHPVRQEVANLTEAAFAAIYDGQKELLEQLLALQKKDIFVATYMVYSKKDSTDYMSIATWSKDVPTYMPVAQNVAFIDNKLGVPSPSLVVPYNAVRAVLQDKMEWLDIYPPRYKVVDFPSAREMERIQEIVAKIP